MAEHPKLIRALSAPGASEKLKHIDGVITKAVVPYRENTEAAIVAFSLIRVARILLRLYPKHAREVLVNEVIVPFLREEEVGAVGGLILQ